jgi:hypothetical protein
MWYLRLTNCAGGVSSEIFDIFDSRLSAQMTYAYVKGFHGDSLVPAGVACITKHFSGGST